MAHHTRVRAPGLWTNFSVLLAAEMELFDEDQYNSINGDDGGTWAPAAQVIIGGSGLTVTGPGSFVNFGGTVGNGKTLTIASGGSLVCATGSTFTIETACIATVDADAVLHVNGEVWIQGLADITVKSGGALVVDSGGSATFSGSATFASGSSLSQVAGASWSLGGTNTLTGFLTVSTGTVTIGSGGTLSFTAGGSLLTGTATAFAFTLAGTTTVQGGGLLRAKISLGSLGDLEVTSGGRLVHDSGSTVTGTITRTASEKRTGAGAWDGGRPATTASDGSYHVTVTDHDTLYVPTLASDRQWTLDAPSDTSAGVEITIIREIVGSAANKLQILDTDGATVIGEFLGGTDKVFSATFKWNGSAYKFHTGFKYVKTVDGPNLWPTF